MVQYPSKKAIPHAEEFGIELPYGYIRPYDWSVIFTEPFYNGKYKYETKFSTCDRYMKMNFNS